MSVNSANAVRFNIGGDLTIATRRSTAVLVGYRYLGGPSVDVTLTPTAILNPDQVFFNRRLTRSRRASRRHQCDCRVRFARAGGPESDVPV